MGKISNISTSDPPQFFKVNSNTGLGKCALDLLLDTSALGCNTLYPLWQRAG